MNIGCSVVAVMVDCRYMEQQLFGPHSPTDATADTMTSTSRDDGADRSTTPPADATPSRHLYTMTVDDVVAELLTYELQRDTRTVQRWCKSGKLRAIIDHEHGDRYLIDPASVRDTVAALLQERDSQAPRQDAMTRPRHDSVGTHTRQPDIDPRQYHFTPHSMRDMVTDSPTETTTTDTTSEQRRDEVAALERRVAELEKEKAMLSVDKEVREQMSVFSL